MYANVDRHGFKPIPAKDRTAVLAAVFVVMCEQMIYGVRRIRGGTEDLYHVGTTTIAHAQ